jgi:hypothetical protein
MNINTAFPSKWLKAADLSDGNDLVLTISHVITENIGQGAEQEVKPVIYFNETDKGLVLNKTNANTISHLFGPETEGWSGKRISIFSTEVDFAGKQTLALRVRMRQPGASSDSTQIKAKTWQEEITELAQKAKGLLGENTSPEHAKECDDAIKAARELFKKSAVATDQEIADAKTRLAAAIAATTPAPF